MRRTRTAYMRPLALGLAAVLVLALALALAVSLPDSRGDAPTPLTVARVSPTPVGAQVPAGSPAVNPLASPSAASPLPSSAPSPTPPGGAYPDGSWLPAGWRHDVECDEDTDRCVIHLFDAAGREQPGWPVPVPEECYPDVATGPGGIAYFACAAGGRVVVHAFGLAGTTPDGWPVRIRGGDVGGTWNDFGWGAGSGISVAPDGTVYVGVMSGRNLGDYAIHALGPEGRARSGWPRRLAGGGQGFMLARDGVVVAWWYEGFQREIGISARRTRFTMLDPDGRTLPGWPIGSRGAASGPVVWRDGSIYYVSESGRVWGHDRMGRVINGWPYRLPFPAAPAFRPDGRLLFLIDGYDEKSQVVVLTRRGRMAPGWPYTTSRTLGAPGCDMGDFGHVPQALAPDGTLYLAPWTERRSDVLALAPNGRVVDGWPYRLSRGWRVSALWRNPDGTLTVLLEIPCEEDPGAEITLTPDGKLVGPPEPPAPTPLEEVYAALRPRGLRAVDGTTSIRQGEEITFAYDLVNRSASRVILPSMILGDLEERRWVAGAHQAWIELLGPETETDCMPWADRKGTWYAAGGHVIVSDEPVVLEPGEGLLQMGGIDGGLSGCLPAGEYRYHVEYWPTYGVAEDEEPIASRSIEFTLTPLAGWSPAPPAPAPSPTPTVTPRPTPTPTPTPRPPPSIPPPG